MSRQQFGRRMAVVGAVSAFAMVLAGCGSSGSGDGKGAADGPVTKKTLKVAVFPTFNGLDGHMAEVKGYFKDEGLKVELVTGAAPSAMMPQLVGGSLDFAIMDMVTPILARSEGVPVVAVAPGNNGTQLKSGEMGVGNLWVRADSPIKSVKDLESAKFAVPQVNSQVWLDVRQAVDKAGGDSSKMKFVETQDQIGALKNGDVDAATSSEPAGTGLLKDPSVRRLDNYVTANGGLAYMFMATESFAKQNASTVAAFQRAILKANKAINADKADAAKVAATYIKAPAELLSAAKYAHYTEEPIKESDIEQAIKRMEKYKVLDKSKAPKPSDLLVSSN